ncbi:MAG: cupin domain-containing protein [Algoriphagus sp.]|uniref:cupin domain-containing protein n=1 Tax=Algoriphagus sp. TaxID=1872435 RepID=UPI002628864B|nr:cupin domain-containing protein [Algoriphagus sp.]MDG1276197.1 cupin domain-containing protein [Algoriphagus sp.]
MKAFHLLLIILLAGNFSCNSSEISQEITFEKLAESTQSWNGDTLPSYPEGQPKVTILKASIPPKAKLEMHEHLVINAGLLLKGELTVIDEFGNRLELKAGDTIIELVNTFHYGINEGTETAEIVVFYAGDDKTPITKIKE